MNQFERARAFESNVKAAEFVSLARHLLLGGGDVAHAAVIAEKARHDNVAGIFKAATSVGGLTKLVEQAAVSAEYARHGSVATIQKSPVSAGTLSSYSGIAQYSALVTAFLESLRTICSFDRMLGDMRKVPLRTRIAISSVAVTGNVVGENQVKPISSLSLEGKQLDVLKALALIVVSDQLIRTAAGGANSLFASELRKAVAAATDNQFIAEITAGVTPIASVGTTPAAIRQDIGAALASMNIGADSRPYILIDGALARQWAFTANDGDQFMQKVTIQGGTLSGVPILVSDAVDHGTFVVADANQIAAGDETITLDTSREATLHLNTEPDSPPTAATVMHNLFQHNTVALKAERYFGVEVLRSNAVALIDAVSSV